MMPGLDEYTPDAAAGTPATAPLTPAPKPRGFTPESARAAAAKRKAKPRKAAARAAADAPAAAAPPAAAPLSPELMTKAVHRSLSFTAQLTGDPRFMTVAEAHAAELAECAREMQVAFGWTNVMDPRAAAVLSTALVCFGAFQTFINAPMPPAASVPDAEAVKPNGAHEAAVVNLSEFMTP